MTLKKFGLNYARCSLEELQGFTKARSIILRKGKEACITALELADSNATFRFEDLPGELRNRVYYELLLLPPHGVRGIPLRNGSEIFVRKVHGCHPHILATCSSIRDEASSILYGANDLEIDIQRYIWDYPQFEGHETHGVDIARLPDQVKHIPGAFGYLNTMYQDFHSVLRRFHRIRIKITTETMSYKPYIHPHHGSLADSLYILVSCLQRSTILKSLRIVGNTEKGHQFVPAQTLNKLLYPLARIFAHFNCEIVGFTEYPTLALHLQSIATEHRQFYEKNALYYATLVRDESEAYSALTEVTNDLLNHRKHSRLRGQMCRMFDQSFQQPEDERKLLEWADRMAQFLTEVHKAEARMALSRALGFWLAAVKRFDIAHKKRIMHFPE
jgi:hypothetical protein